MTDHQHPASALEHDHHEIDAHFAAFVDTVRRGTPDLAPLLAAGEGLRHHIWVEEEAHFPLARAAGLMGPVLVMLREHGLIWGALDRLDALATASPLDADAVLAAWAELEAVLSAHNLKEEQILYPAGDAAFTAEQADAILVALREGVRPDGWRCAYASA